MEKGGFTESLTAIVLAIIGVATLAVIVSKNANTTGVIGAAASAFTSSLGVALSPITSSGGGTFPIS